MTYSAAHHATAVSDAHLSKRDSKRDGGLAVDLLRQQNGVCFDCGKAPATEFAHFVRAEGRTTSDMIVLGAMSCRRCNMIHDRLTKALGTDGTLPLEYLLANGRAERIPTTYPTRKECEALHLSTLAQNEASIMADVEAAMAAL